MLCNFYVVNRQCSLAMNPPNEVVIIEITECEIYLLGPHRTFSIGPFGKGFVVGNTPLLLTTK